MQKNVTINTTTRRPKVSIMLITYNHEKYIAQALESILMQETEFDYEIAVIEDCSTDRTKEIITQYAQKFPDKVKPYFNEKNLGYEITQKNFYQGYFRLTGDYMAILEGDDYWSSPHKLQKQVTFLEANPEYVACAHNTIKVYEDGSREPHRFLYSEGRADDHSIENLILLWSYFHTTTLLFRNVFRGAPPRYFRNKWSCEIFITIAHAQFGKIRYFDEDMAVYRAHSGGRFSNLSMLEGWFFNIGGLRRYNQWLGYRYLKTFSRSIVYYCNNVLSDKGKEAELLTWYQYIKYVGIRTLYQIIILIFAILDFFYAPIEIWITSYNRSKANYRTRHTVLLGAICLFFLISIRQFLKATIKIVYHGVNALLPVSIRKSIKKFEAAHPRFKNFRLSIIFRRVK